MTYPKVYKPRGVLVLIDLFYICLILFFLFTQIFPLSSFRFYLPQDGAKFWVSTMGLLLAFGVIFALVIESIGYTLTFTPDEIKVTTLLGTKTIEYGDISFYSWKVGNFSGRSLSYSSFYRLYLVSRDSSQNVLDISLLKGPNEKIIKIPLNLKLDKEFYDWIATIPCELGKSPLPKVEKFS